MDFQKLMKLNIANTTTPNIMTLNTDRYEK